MLSITVCTAPAQERRGLERVCRALAARASGEDLEWFSCAALPELEGRLNRADGVDVVCLDMAQAGAVAVAERLRERWRQALLVLIVERSLSPLEYIRPTILAAALMLRPLDEGDMARTMEEVLLAWRQRRGADGEQFVFSTGGETRRVPCGEILYFESREKRIYLRTRSREYGFYDTLEQLSGRLPEGFLRCHKSFIVNLSFLRGVNLSRNTLDLEGDIAVPVSRTYKPAVKAWKAAQI